MDSDLNQEINKLLPALEIILPKETLSEVMVTASDEMYLFHFGLGLFIRNTCLEPGSKLYEAFIRADIYHTDDMSAIILSSFSAYIKAE